MSSFDELMKAKTLLGLHDKATLSEIKFRYKTLMQQWHPDKHPDESERSHQMSSRINAAYQLLLNYCKNYEYDFSEEKIKRETMSASEWWNERFGGR